MSRSNDGCDTFPSRTYCQVAGQDQNPRGPRAEYVARQLLDRRALGEPQDTDCRETPAASRQDLFSRSGKIRHELPTEASRVEYRCPRRPNDYASIRRQVDPSGTVFDSLIKPMSEEIVVNSLSRQTAATVSP